MTILRNTLVAAALVLGFGAAAQAQDEEPVRVGFIYVGPIGDFGWSYQHDQGRLALEETFGEAVETSYVESVPEGADAERVLRQMAQAGNDIIFATSFGYMNSVVNVAKQFPDVKFEHATGYQRADNLATYSSRFYEGRHVIGLIAGRMTKSNVIGYIGSYPIPEVIRGINAAYLAAKSVNPDVQFRIVWSNTWFDPFGLACAKVDGNGVLHIWDKYAPGSAESNALRAFVNSWDAATRAAGGFIRQSVSGSARRTATNAANAARAANPSLYPSGVSPGHLPDVGWGGSPMGPFQPLLSRVNYYVGGTARAVPVGTSYSSVAISNTPL